jgi:hypothetical protein
MLFKISPELKKKIIITFIIFLIITVTLLIFYALSTDGSFTAYKPDNCVKSETNNTEVTCGPGRRKYTRQYNPAKFFGKDLSNIDDVVKWENCNLSPCPIDGRFTNWESIGECKMSASSSASSKTCRDATSSDHGKILQTRNYIEPQYGGLHKPDKNILRKWVGCDEAGINLNICTNVDETCSAWTDSSCTCNGVSYKKTRTRTYVANQNNGSVSNEDYVKDCRNIRSEIVNCDGEAGESRSSGICPRNSSTFDFPTTPFRECTPSKGPNRKKTYTTSYTFPIGGTDLELHNSSFRTIFTPEEISTIKSLQFNTTSPSLAVYTKLEGNLTVKYTIKRKNINYPHEYTIEKEVPCADAPYHTLSDIRNYWRTETGCSTNDFDINAQNKIGFNMAQLLDMETVAIIKPHFKEFKDLKYLYTDDSFKERTYNENSPSMIESCYGSNGLLVIDNNNKAEYLDKDNQARSDRLYPRIKFMKMTGGIEILRSPNKLLCLFMNENGTLSIKGKKYATYSTQDIEYPINMTYITGSTYTNIHYLEFDKNGNLSYKNNSNNIIWQSNTADSTAYLELDNYGDLRIKSSNSTIIKDVFYTYFYVDDNDNSRDKLKNNYLNNEGDHIGSILYVKMGFRRDSSRDQIILQNGNWKLIFTREGELKIKHDTTNKTTVTYDNNIVVDYPQSIEQFIYKNTSLGSTDKYTVTSGTSAIERIVLFNNGCLRYYSDNYTELKVYGTCNSNSTNNTSYLELTTIGNLVYNNGSGSSTTIYDSKIGRWKRNGCSTNIFDDNMKIITNIDHLHNHEDIENALVQYILEYIIRTLGNRTSLKNTQMITSSFGDDGYININNNNLWAYQIVYNNNTARFNKLYGGFAITCIGNNIEILANYQWKLIFNTNGSLVITGPNNTNAPNTIVNSNTNHRTLKMLKDGRLAIYNDSGTAFWDSTFPDPASPGAYLELTSDGSLYIKSYENKVIKILYDRVRDYFNNSQFYENSPNIVFSDKLGRVFPSNWTDININNIPNDDTTLNAFRGLYKPADDQQWHVSQLNLWNNFTGYVETHDDNNRVMKNEDADADVNFRTDYDRRQFARDRHTFRLPRDIYGALNPARTNTVPGYIRISWADGEGDDQHENWSHHFLIMDRPNVTNAAFPLYRKADNKTDFYNDIMIQNLTLVNNLRNYWRTAGGNPATQPTPATENLIYHDNQCGRNIRNQSNALTLADNKSYKYISGRCPTNQCCSKLGYCGGTKDRNDSWCGAENNLMNRMYDGA